MSIRGSFSDQALVVAGNFAFTIAMVRVAGVDAYGVYTLLWGVVQLLIAVQGSLFIAPFQSLGHELQSRYGESYLYAVFGQQQLFSLTVATCLFLGLFAFPSQYGPVSLPLAAGGAAYFLLTQEYFRRLQLATGRTQRAVIGDAFRYIGPVVWLAMLAPRTSVTLSDIFLFLGLACVPSLALNLKYFGFFRGKGYAALAEVLRIHWPFVRWLTPSIAFQWINANLVFYAVGWFVGETEVGLLRMAQTLSILYLILLEVLENVVPRQAAIRMKAGGRAEMERYVIRIGAWAGLAFAGFLSIVLPWIEFWLNFIFGAKAASVPVEFVWLFCIVPALMVPTYCFNVLLRSMSLTSAIFAADLLASLVSTAGVLSIMWFGALAAVATILVAQALRLALLVATYRQSTGHWHS